MKERGGMACGEGDGGQKVMERGKEKTKPKVINDIRKMMPKQRG